MFIIRWLKYRSAHLSIRALPGGIRHGGPRHSGSRHRGPARSLPDPSCPRAPGDEKGGGGDGRLLHFSSFNINAIY